jgi:hypothetical protein
MKIDRRDFIKTAGGLALASVAQSFPTFGAIEKNTPNSNRAKVAVFYDPSFPQGEIDLPDKETLAKALEEFDIAFFDVDQLNANLDQSRFDCFVIPYGSLFPKAAFNAIFAYLRAGGNWVNLGGTPLSIPVDKDATGWREETPQTAYHKKIGITQSFRFASKGVRSYKPTDTIESARYLIDEFTAEETDEFYLRFTSKKEFPDEDGSDGPREAILYPLLHGFDDSPRRITAPILCIDRIEGEFAGGRWIFANFRGTITPKAIRLLTQLAVDGAAEFKAHPSFACYSNGELPTFSVSFGKPKRTAGEFIKGQCKIEVADSNGKIVEKNSVNLKPDGSSAAADIAMSSSAANRLTPGFYEVRASLETISPGTSHNGSVLYKTGFWVHDENLLSSGAPLAPDGDYFIRDGKPFVVTGTTYMATDVHRRFLLEPNPYVWRTDFGEMSAAGMNMIRTGIWTGWQKHLNDDGTVKESVLRAMDAFLQSARTHNMPVIFTFFAFLPEQWGGENVFLDPKSVNAQKQFVRTFVERYKNVNDLMWDLINEPSFCSPKQLWNCRPNYDKFEIAAWQQWLKDRYPATSDAERISRLQEIYNSTPDEALELPKIEEFNDDNIFYDHHPVKVIDYRLFAEDIFVKWVREMTGVVRTYGNPNQLVTVGQDEGGLADRLNPQFFGESLDFTSLHNWWLNEHLIWDSVVSKVPGKLNLVEETGVMFYEKMDGSAWRTEEEVRNLLERKLAISIGAGGAGFLEWLWNANYCMPSDNEAAIGLLRPDGTAKPEFQPVADFASFFAANSHFMTGRKNEDVLMVIPHSQMFSTRDYATQATQRCVRAIYYHCNMSLRAVSEYRTDLLTDVPKLIIVPSPRTLSETCWKSMLQLAEQGATIAISGNFDSDEHWLPVERLNSLGFQTSSVPVMREEYLTIDGSEYLLEYHEEKIQRVEKSVVRGIEKPGVRVIQRGKGKIIWSPLPIELSDTIDPLVAYYRFAMKESGAKPGFAIDKENPSIGIMQNIYTDAILYAFVSETDRDTEIKFTDALTGAVIAVTIPAQRSVMMFIRRPDGKILARLG